MKISKLFHWLYALLMLAPVFAIGSAILVDTFNMSAKNEANYQINYRYKTNDVSTITDIKISDLYSNDLYIYHIDNFIDADLASVSYYSSQEFRIYLLNYKFESSLVDGPFFDEIVLSEYNFPNIALSYYVDEFTHDWVFNYFYISDTHVDLCLGDLFDSGSLYLSDVDFLFVDYDSRASFYSSYISVNDIKVSASTYNEILSVEELPLTEDVFYRSVDKVINSPLFNWSYDSFLVAPFSYIVVLFSMPSNSPIVMMLSYWLAISIIWLVFDLVMYVPLLVHRWIDKGVIE